MFWSNEQKVFVIGAYYRLKSYKDSQAQFRQQYPDERRNFPHVNTIKYWVKMLKKGTYVPTCSKQKQKQRLLELQKISNQLENPLIRRLRRQFDTGVSSWASHMNLVGECL